MDASSARRNSSDISSDEHENEESLRKLREHTLTGEWAKVVGMYAYAWTHSVIITGSSKDTALHVAIKDGQEDAVENLVHKMDEHGTSESALEIMNDRDNTPLHLAALTGSVRMCKCMLEGNKKTENLLRLRNKEGESPLFLAALSDHVDAFTYLHSKIQEAFKDDDKLPFCRRDNGDTILHSTLQREHFDLAWKIIDLYPELRSYHNERGLTPLHVHAMKPSAFKSSSVLRWWEQIIYYTSVGNYLMTSKFRKSLKLEIDIDLRILMVQGIPVNLHIPYNSSRMQKKDSSRNEKGHSNHSEERKYPMIYDTCFEFFKLVCGFVSTIGISLPNTRNNEEPVDAENPQDSIDMYHYPKNYVTFFETFIFICGHVLGLTGFGNSFRAIVRARIRHKWSSLILNKIMEKDPSQAYVGEEGRQPTERLHDTEGIQNIKRKDRKQQSEVGEIGTLNQMAIQDGGVLEKKLEKRKDSENKEAIKDTALLIAAKNGALEVVNKILNVIPVAIYDTTSDNKNVLLVAVENRQTFVFEAMRKRFEGLGKQNRWCDLFHQTDTKENTILHLAAKASLLQHSPWRIQGSAMQMHWEIKWFQFVKELSPPHFLFLKNKEDKTPGEIFIEDHGKLVKQSSEWLKDTSESCSVVAALIAGVAFATSSTVPGGNDDQTGKPTLEGRPAFNLFAITALIALCFSVTALVMFLSVLTSRKQARDFRRNLPLKLLLGLNALFVSIASMLVSFCAAHFFIVEDLKHVVFPIYAATCVPISFYAIAQFPLYFDLLRAIFKLVPQPSCHGDEYL